MWSVGNKAVFLPATTDSAVGLARGLERATAAIGHGVSLRQEQASLVPAPFAPVIPFAFYPLRALLPPNPKP
jgi:hypothetical protein